MSNLIGNAPNQVPTNADLGGLAYQDPAWAAVGNITVNYNLTVVGNISLLGNITGSASTLVATNFSSGNTFISGGAIGVTTSGAVSRVANVYSTLENVTNFSTGNAVITGGSITGVTGAFTYLTVTNFSSGNIYTTTGNLTSANVSTGNITASGNVTVTGNLIVTGNIVTLNYETITNTEIANIIIASGNITSANLSTGNITANGNLVFANGNIILNPVGLTLSANSVQPKSYTDLMSIVFGV